MAIYTTFFLCEPSALPKAFPTWKPPLAKPVVRTFRDPLTNEMVSRASDAPDFPQQDGQAHEPPDYTVVSVTGDYAAFIEGRLPPAVRALPHWCAKGLTEVELEPLETAFKVSPLLTMAMYAPPAVDSLLFRMDERAQAELAKVNEPALQKIAAHWATTLSDDDHTLLQSGARLEGMQTKQATAYLRELSALAKRASKSQRMYLLIEA